MEEFAEHDQDLAESVVAWCDAELLSDERWQRGTIVGEWHLVVTRQGFGAEGQPISQTFVTSSVSAPSRILGILREATLKAEVQVMELYSSRDCE